MKSGFSKKEFLKVALVGSVLLSLIGCGGMSSDLGDSQKPKNPTQSQGALKNQLEIGSLIVPINHGYDPGDAVEAGDKDNLCKELNEQAAWHLQNAFDIEAKLDALISRLDSLHGFESLAFFHHNKIGPTLGQKRHSTEIKSLLPRFPESRGLLQAALNEAESLETEKADHLNAINALQKNCPVEQK